MAKQRPVRLGAACLLLQLQQLLQQQQQTEESRPAPGSLLQQHVQQCLAFMQQGRDPQQRQFALLLLENLQTVGFKP